MSQAGRTVEGPFLARLPFPFSEPARSLMAVWKLHVASSVIASTHIATPSSLLAVLGRTCTCDQKKPALTGALREVRALQQNGHATQERALC